MRTSVRGGSGIFRAMRDRMAHTVLVDHAAEILGVSRRTVYYRIREGKLRTVRTACGSQRVLMESIEALLREEAGWAPSDAARSSDSDGAGPKAAGSGVTGRGADV
jgi:excisionase family DNA binding protein